MQYLKILFLTGILLVLVIFFSRCFQNPPSGDPRGDRYAGAKTCVSCHQHISGSYAHSNHYKTSSETNHALLKKLIAPSGDHFYFSDSSYVRIEERENALFQSSVLNARKELSGRFDISFGSAEKAQTYGYWKENKLYELPLTYFTSMNTWANSPGFSGRHANFGRVIESRCFECHASYIDKEFVRSGSLAVSEKLDRNSIIYGIDCERCHGPAAEHVRFHQENPAVRKGRFITSISSLSRQQQLDVCAVCHSGNDKTPQRPLFSFTPGDTLSNFLYPDFGSGSPEPDVHGKQMQLLASSLCFQKTGMTCATCHSAHGPEENKTADFIPVCMTCHQHSDHAKGILKENEQIKRDFNLVSTNCIDCHMPLQTSKTIHFNNGAESKNMPYLIRTHKIAIYK
ncbi:MAG TPA: multiheme c-type cytochrome [Puia sp.]|nr:multiheme c-type cytochrome [Puia sp.]